MKERKDTLLTIDLYKSIIEKIVKEIVELKNEQGEAINEISIQKEILIKFKEELKALKCDIKSTKKIIHLEKSKLRKINNKLNYNNSKIFELNNDFVGEEDSYVDLNNFSNQKKCYKKGK